MSIKIIPLLIFVFMVNPCMAVTIPSGVLFSTSNSSVIFENVSFDAFVIENGTMSFNVDGNWSNITVQSTSPTEVVIKEWKAASKIWSVSCEQQTKYRLTGLPEDCGAVVNCDAVEYTRSQRGTDGIIDWVYDGEGSHEFSVFSYDLGTEELGVEELQPVIENIPTAPIEDTAVENITTDDTVTPDIELLDNTSVDVVMPEVVENEIVNMSTVEELNITENESIPTPIVDNVTEVIIEAVTENITEEPATTEEFIPEGTPLESITDTEAVPDVIETVNTTEFNYTSENTTEFNTPQKGKHPNNNRISR